MKYKFRSELKKACKESFKAIITKYYEMLTDHEKSVFHRIWKSIDSIPEKDWDQCLDLIERTLKNDGRI